MRVSRYWRSHTREIGLVIFKHPESAKMNYPEAITLGIHLWVVSYWIVLRKGKAKDVV